MTIKLSREALAKLALTTAVLLSGLVATEAMAQAHVNGLTGRDLLNGGTGAVRVSSPVELAPMVPSAKSNRALQPIARPTDVAVPARVASSAHAADLMWSRSDSEAVLKDSEAVREGRAIAQESTVTTEDTFAPLSDEEIRELLLIEPNSLPREFSRRPRPIPASTFLTPNAYGAGWGEAYLGLAQVTAGKPKNSNFDGSAALGLGFGDPIKNIGLEASVSIISLNGFADDGIVGFKLHKIFPQADNLSVALGWSNPIKWGAARERENNFYGVATKRFDLQPNRSNPLPLTASLGVGTGTFRSIGAEAADSNSPNVFGSLGLRVIPEVSLITSWTGSALGVAASTAPFNFPLVITLGASDITDNTAEGPRLNITTGYSFSF